MNNPNEAFHAFVQRHIEHTEAQINELTAMEAEYNQLLQECGEQLPPECKAAMDLTRQYAESKAKRLEHLKSV